MIDLIIMSMAFISAWLLTVQIFKMYSNNSFDVKQANTYKFDVMVFDYDKYKSFGIMIGYVNDVRYEFIDDHFGFSKIINSHMGDTLSVICLGNVHGIVVFDTEFHLYNVEEKSYKQFVKFN